MDENYDFGGWATVNDLKCADGRIIRQNAFKEMDGQRVPLVWNHNHKDVSNVLGYAILENRNEGVYVYGYFNNTPKGQDAKEQVQHGDINALSIFANNLREKGGDVLHGIICEVSLVLAGANPGAYVEKVLAHSADGIDEDTDAATIYNGVNLELAHSEKEDEKEVMKDEKKEEKKESSEKKTIGEVYEAMTDDQKMVVAAFVKAAKEDEGEEKDNPEGGEKMKHNAFDDEDDQVTRKKSVLSHAAQGEILTLAKDPSCGSLKTAIEIYSQNNELAHGLNDISGFVQTGNGNVSNLFPEYVEANGRKEPELITNNMDWVDAIMAKTQKIPHGRVRTSHVDIRNIDSLKAKGYQKGNKKNLTGNYALVRRTTDPQTVYVTSELHRDDVIDIEDFDYVTWQYHIDQISLKEELAVATMLGDDRQDSDPEKIFPDHIRPIWVDDELYTIHKDIDYDAMAAELQGSDATANFGKSFIYAEAIITALRMARKDFRGTGKADLYITTDMHNTMILARDRNGRRIYETDAELASALGAANIYEVTQFEDKIRTDADNVKHKLLAIYVNMADYGYGASKGGDVTHFTDFDIKFNQLQSLLETRKSGQLTRIKSAIVLEEVVTTP